LISDLNFSKHIWSNQDSLSLLSKILQVIEKHQQELLSQKKKDSMDLTQLFKVDLTLKEHSPTLEI